MTGAETRSAWSAREVRIVNSISPDMQEAIRRGRCLVAELRGEEPDPQDRLTQPELPLDFDEDNNLKEEN